MKTNQVAHGLNVPIKANSVESPIVNYGEGANCINFVTDDDRWGRVTFERLDSIKVSQGEYQPFPNAPDQEQTFHWVTTVSDSAWLQERYEYEKRYYGNSRLSRELIDEVVTDYFHYVFHFHDQFVEVLSSGIWFESSATILGTQEIGIDHPLRDLSYCPVSEEFEAHGIACQVRYNPLTRHQIEERAKLCSQKIMEVAVELDGRVSPCWTLIQRQNNKGQTSFRSSNWGNRIEFAL